jgi:hypothetical protein
MIITSSSSSSTQSSFEGETILEASCQVIQQFMARDPEELKFTILALSSNSAAYD